MNYDMKKSLSHYRVIPRTARAGIETEINILPVGKSKSFDDSAEYTVTLIPAETYGYTRIEPTAFDTLTVTPKGGAISFTYSFTDEQEWVISIKKAGDAGDLALDFCIYSLEDDLYFLNPYMGDLHVHSNASDGREDPAIVAANYRKCGFDFFALTDHHEYKPSEIMCETYKDVPLGIKLFHGEEVHVPTAWIHVVNFDSRYSVNELYRKNKEKIDAELKAEAEKTKTPKGVNPLEYVYRKWITAEIRRAGGLSITVHPYWFWGGMQSYNMSDRMLAYVFETGIYDAFELIGGQSAHENNLQISFYHEELANGRRIPIVGSSDSHGTDPANYFGFGRTVVFAKDTDHDSIVGAIKDHYSVAIEQQRGEEPRVYGSHRLTKYTRFLLDYYFPAHDELCFEEGILMREYALGNAEARDSLARLAPRTSLLVEKLLRNS